MTANPGHQLVRCPTSFLAVRSEKFPGLIAVNRCHPTFLVRAEAFWATTMACAGEF